MATRYGKGIPEIDSPFQNNGSVPKTSPSSLPGPYLSPTSLSLRKKGLSYSLKKDYPILLSPLPPPSISPSPSNPPTPFGNTYLASMRSPPKPLSFFLDPRGFHGCERRPPYENIPRSNLTHVHEVRNPIRGFGTRIQECATLQG